MVKIAKSSLTMIELKRDQMHHKYVLYTKRAKRPFFCSLSLLLKIPLITIITKQNAALSLMDFP